MKPGEPTPGEPADIEKQEQDSERLWKTPNTLDAEGLSSAADESRPEDVGLEGLDVVDNTPDSGPTGP